MDPSTVFCGTETYPDKGRAGTACEFSGRGEEEGEGAS